MNVCSEKMITLDEMKRTIDPAVSWLKTLLEASPWMTPLLLQTLR